MGVTAVDLGLRGAAAGLFLFTVLVIAVKARPLDSVKLLGAGMSITGAAYAIVSAPFVPKSAVWWTLPIIAASPVIVWLWARATFDDDFVIRRRHGVLWLAVVGLGFWAFLAWTTWPMLAKAGGRLLSIVDLVLALSAAVQTVRTWADDLVAGRRRLRLAVHVLSVLFIVFVRGLPNLTLHLVHERRRFRQPRRRDGPRRRWQVHWLHGACFIHRKPGRSWSQSQRMLPPARTARPEPNHQPMTAAGRSRRCCCAASTI